MSKEYFDLRGFDELEKALKALGPQVGTKEGQKAVMKGARHIAKNIRAAAPVGDADTSRTYSTATGTVKVDYGHLKRNIRVQRKRKKGANTVAGILGTGAAFWGKFLEFGTRKMAARPWFGPAFKQAGPEALNIIKMELKSALDRAARGVRK